MKVKTLWHALMHLTIAKAVSFGGMNVESWSKETGSKWKIYSCLFPTKSDSWRHWFLGPSSSVSPVFLELAGVSGSDERCGTSVRPSGWRVHSWMIHRELGVRFPTGRSWGHPELKIKFFEILCPQITFYSLGLIQNDWKITQVNEL